MIISGKTIFDRTNKHLSDYNYQKDGYIMYILDRIALTLAVIGGINWGSVGLFQFDIVAWACGGQTALLSRIIYTLVGIAAIWCTSLLFREREEGYEHTRG